MKEITKKYGILIVILSLIIVVLIGIAATTLLKRNNVNKNNENNMEKNSEVQDNENNEKGQEENNVIKVVIDEDDVNQNKQNFIDEGNTQEENTSKYYIKINNEMNVVTIYKKDKVGEYTIPIKAMICSIGEATPTSGVYKLTIRFPWRGLQGNVYGQYAVRITGNILFHSVPYTDKRKDALEWWEYDKLGTFASLGCVRLKVEDAKWIYENCESGTPVEFYYDSDPGPLGKPTAMKISGYSDELRNWDPTDPDPENPWKTYQETINQT